MQKSSYQEYLQSDWWKKRRQKAIDKANGKCELCGSTENLCVHHLLYEDMIDGKMQSLLGQERDKDLVCLCRDCHSAWHCAMDKVAEFTGENKIKFEKKYLKKLNEEWLSLNKKDLEKVIHTFKKGRRGRRMSDFVIQVRRVGDKHRPSVYVNAFANIWKSK